MHANQASSELKEELRKWLQKSVDGQVTRTAEEDLKQIISAKDLSAVSIDPEKKLPQVKTSSAASTKAEPNDDGGGRGGGFLALFGCASKRK